MSVLWGITGSLDTRLVNDGKAADVAYDISSVTKTKTSAISKVVAEVVIEGTINNKIFEIRRRRGSF